MSARPVAIFCAIIAAGALAAQPAFKRLDAKQIRAIVIGKAVTDDSHWSDHLLADGTLKAWDLGELKPGAWKIERDELCLTRFGKGGDTQCFEIWVAGDAVQYRRDGYVVADAHLRAIPKR